MMESKVTALIISYNEKEYLNRAISSIQTQIYKNIDILIGDDGSNDGSIEDIKDFRVDSVFYNAA